VLWQVKIIEVDMRVEDIQEGRVNAVGVTGLRKIIKKK
jgi:hypothetical protein